MKTAFPACCKTGKASSGEKRKEAIEEMEEEKNHERNIFKSR